MFRTGPYAIGFTTSFRMGQMLRHQTQLPDPPDGASPDEMERFFVAEFVPADRESFKEHGFAKTASFPSTGNMKFKQQGQEVGGMFVVGVGGQIFEIREDYHLGIPSVPYSSIGSGAAVANGALHALRAVPDISARQRAESALEASETYCSVVRGPFHFVETQEGRRNVSRQLWAGLEPAWVHRVVSVRCRWCDESSTTIATTYYR